MLGPPVKFLHSGGHVQIIFLVDPPLCTGAVKIVTNYVLIPSGPFRPLGKQSFQFFSKVLFLCSAPDWLWTLPDQPVAEHWAQAFPLLGESLVSQYRGAPLAWILLFTWWRSFLGVSDGTFGGHTPADQTPWRLDHIDEPTNGAKFAPTSVRAA